MFTPPNSPDSVAATCRLSPFSQKSRAVDVGESVARDDGDAVIALLAVERDVRVAEFRERCGRKIRVRAFRLLQTQHIRLLLLRKRATASMRRRTELMFQVTTEKRKLWGSFANASLHHGAAAPPSAAGRLPTGFRRTGEAPPTTLPGFRRARRNRRGRPRRRGRDRGRRRRARPASNRRFPPASFASASSPSAAVRASSSGSAACSAAGSPDVSRSAGGQRAGAAEAAVEVDGSRRRAGAAPYRRSPCKAWISGCDARSVRARPGPRAARTLPLRVMRGWLSGSPRPPRLESSSEARGSAARLRVWRESSDIRNIGAPSQSLATPTNVVSGAPASSVASAAVRAKRRSRFASRRAPRIDPPCRRLLRTKFRPIVENPVNPSIFSVTGHMRRREPRA